MEDENVRLSMNRKEQYSRIAFMREDNLALHLSYLTRP